MRSDFGWRIQKVIQFHGLDSNISHSCQRFKYKNFRKNQKAIKILVLLSAKGLEIWYVWKVLDVDLYKIIINIIKSVMSSIAYISNDFTVTVLTTPAVSPEFTVHSLYLTFEVTGNKYSHENFHSNTWMLYEPHHWFGYFPLLLYYWLWNCCCQQRYVLTWRCIVSAVFILLWTILRLCHNSFFIALDFAHLWASTFYLFTST